MSMATAAAAENPLLDQAALPRFGAVEPANVVPAVTALVQQLEADLAALEAKLAAAEGGAAHTFESVLDELERLRAPLEYAWGVVGHLNGVKNSEPLRAAHQAMQPKVVRVMTLLGQSKPVYDALLALQAGDALDEAQRRIVDAGVRSMKRSGVGLEGEQKERFNQLLMRQAELSTKFSNNVLDSTKAFALELTAAPRRWRACHPARARWRRRRPCRRVMRAPRRRPAPG